MTWQTTLCPCMHASLLREHQSIHVWGNWVLQVTEAVSGPRILVVWRCVGIVGILTFQIKLATKHPKSSQTSTRTATRTGANNQSASGWFTGVASFPTFKKPWGPWHLQPTTVQGYGLGTKRPPSNPVVPTLLPRYTSGSLLVSWRCTKISWPPTSAGLYFSLF